jgi:hypothetical protein
MSDNPVRSRLRDVPPDVEEVTEPRPKRGRRTSELLIGALLVLGGGLAGLIVFQRGDPRFVVVATSSELQRGTIIDRSHLVPLEVGLIPNHAITPAQDAADLLGKRLLVDVPAGVPLTRFVVSDARPLTGAQALIPLQLERGAVPSEIARGDMVQVIISFPNRGVDAPSPEILTETMEVFAIESADEFDDRVNLTVVASPDSAIDLARADRIQVMKVSSR